MVTTGFSKPYIAKYSENAGVVTYSGCMVLGRGVSVDISINTASENNFSADNRIAETQSGQMVSGTATITIDGLEEDAATMALNLGTPSTVEIPGDSEPTEVTMLDYAAEMSPPYLGFGYVWRTQMEGVVSYRAVILTKIQLSIPGDSAQTEDNGQINWQTQELTGTLMRDDTEKPKWKRVSAPQTTEAAAEKIIQTIFGGVEEETRVKQPNAEQTDVE